MRKKFINKVSEKLIPENNMKLEYVLTSCNLNNLYCDFIPIFIRAWNKIVPGIKIKIVLIAEDIPEKINEYKDNIILFKPIEDIPTSYISQYIRILYPSLLNSENGVLITDIDMIPMNKEYYTEQIKFFEKNKFIYYKEYIYPKPKQYMLCYHIACSKIWSEVFNISKLEDIVDRLKDRYRKEWTCDQQDLYIYINKWSKKEKDFVMLNDKITKFNRLCRARFPALNDNIINKIKSGFYTDYHMLRPHEGNNKIINEKILEII